MVGTPRGTLCPKCSKKGSGLHTTWVLNAIKKRYEPYYRFAHSVKIDGVEAIKWCYIPKAEAVEILGSEKLQKKYNMNQDLKRKSRIARIKKKRAKRKRRR